MQQTQNSPAAGTGITGTPSGAREHHQHRERRLSALGARTKPTRAASSRRAAAAACGRRRQPAAPSASEQHLPRERDRSHENPQAERKQSGSSRQRPSAGARKERPAGAGAAPRRAHLCLSAGATRRAGRAGSTRRGRCAVCQLVLVERPLVESSSMADERVDAAAAADRVEMDLQAAGGAAAAAIVRTCQWWQPLAVMPLNAIGADVRHSGR